MRDAVTCGASSGTGSSAQCLDRALGRNAADIQAEDVVERVGSDAGEAIGLGNGHPTLASGARARCATPGCASAAEQYLGSRTVRAPGSRHRRALLGSAGSRHGRTLRAEMESEPPIAGTGPGKMPADHDRVGRFKGGEGRWGRPSRGADVGRGEGVWGTSTCPVDSRGASPRHARIAPAASSESPSSRNGIAPHSSGRGELVARTGAPARP